MSKKIVVVGCCDTGFARAVAAQLIEEVEVITVGELDPSAHDPWPEIITPRPLGNEDTGKGKRKSGKRRYEPPKFG